MVDCWFVEILFEGPQYLLASFQVECIWYLAYLPGIWSNFEEVTLENKLRFSKQGIIQQINQATNQRHETEFRAAPINKSTNQQIN